MKKPTKKKKYEHPLLSIHGPEDQLLWSLKKFLKEKYDNEIRTLKSHILSLQKKVDGIKFKVIYGKKSEKKKGMVEYECPVCGHKWEDEEMFFT